MLSITSFLRLSISSFFHFPVLLVITDLAVLVLISIFFNLPLLTEQYRSYLLKSVSRYTLFLPSKVSVLSVVGKISLK